MKMEGTEKRVAWGVRTVGNGQCHLTWLVSTAPDAIGEHKVPAARQAHFAAPLSNKRRGDARQAVRKRGKHKKVPRSWRVGKKSTSARARARISSQVRTDGMAWLQSDNDKRASAAKSPPQNTGCPRPGVFLSPLRTRAKKALFLNSSRQRHLTRAVGHLPEPHSWMKPGIHVLVRRLLNP
jgi:hypothetical protein